jgi:hypothetical protein
MKMCGMLMRVVGEPSVVLAEAAYGVHALRTGNGAD